MNKRLHSEQLGGSDIPPPRDPLEFAFARLIHWRMFWFATAIVATLCVICVLWVDRPVAIYFKSLSASGFAAFFRIITAAGESTVWYAFALIAGLVCWQRSRASHGAIRFLWRLRARSMVFVMSSMAISGTLVNILKMIFGRYRPRYLFEETLYGFSPFALDLKSSGFPSGHTQSIFAAMLALSFVWPRWRATFLALAVLVGASRFITTVHYPADVIAGAYIAIVIALVMRKVFERDGLALAWSGGAMARPR